MEVTNFILRIKEQETHLTLQEHNDDDDDDDDEADMSRWFNVNTRDCSGGTQFSTESNLSYSWVTNV